ncbi:hypothetical protein KEM54_006200 [Ascosphaera aggregata]|nr:hypothetical protein KEM54_006200 [Ascosphaera aggregata]
MADSKRQIFAAKAAASVPGSVATPLGNGSPGGTVALETALSSSIGARIRVSIASPTPMTIEGSLFAACHMTNIIAIDTASTAAAGSASTDNVTPTQALAQRADIHFVPVSRIQSFELLSLADTQQQQTQRQISSDTQSRTSATAQPSSILAGSPAPSNATSPATFTNAIPSIYPLDMRALNARAANAIAEAQEQERRRGKGVTKEAQDIFDAFSRTMPTRWDGTNIIVADQVLITHPYRPGSCKPYGPNADMNSAAIIRVRKVLEMERKKIELRNASAALGLQKKLKSNPSAANQPNGGNQIAPSAGTPAPIGTPASIKPAVAASTGSNTPVRIGVGNQDSANEDLTLQAFAKLGVEERYIRRIFEISAGSRLLRKVRSRLCLRPTAHRILRDKQNQEAHSVDALFWRSKE